MATNIVVTLDKRRKRKDNTFPLILRLSHNRKTTALPLNYFIGENDWDEKKRVIKKGYKGTQSVIRLNKFFQKKRSDALDIITKLEEKSELNTLSIVQLKESIIHTAEKISFCSYGEKQIEQLKEANRLGTARSYQDTLRMIKKYNKGKDFSLEELNYFLILKNLFLIF
ncbi:conserved hypothetical protein [Tenacibaculum litopenaei]|uniref:phage integrase SAM-like domain-containing protein n=1 Tax=Tenacibaculum litopenaei TaxID=396016 RepID=UPI003895C858